MHKIHHTEAFVLKSLDYAEANKRIWLYTKDFGLVVAVVQGVRKSGAKLVSQIGDYSYIKVDLIRGKEVWRLISASLIDNPISGIERHPTSRAYVRTLASLSRFTSIENDEQEIFDHLIEFKKIIGSDINAKYLDGLSLLKIFYILGYIGVETDFINLLQKDISEALNHIDESLYKKIVTYTQRAIEQSHL